MNEQVIIYWSLDTFTTQLSAVINIFYSNLITLSRKEEAFIQGD
jgi:hypothetical protein